MHEDHALVYFRLKPSTGVGHGNGGDLREAGHGCCFIGSQAGV